MKAFCTATSWELNSICLKDFNRIDKYFYINKDKNILLFTTGVGKTKTINRIKKAIEKFQIDSLIIFGMCGGLDKSLRTGDIVVASKNYYEKLNRNSFYPSTINLQGFAVGNSVTVDRLINTCEEKERLFNKYNAITCEMENYFIFEACQKSNIRVTSIRCVLDSFKKNLENNVIKAFDARSKRWKILLNPIRFYKMMLLLLIMSKARKKLGKVIGKLIG